jgi:hypothetical protein
MNKKAAIINFSNSDPESFILQGYNEALLSNIYKKCPESDWLLENTKIYNVEKIDDNPDERDVLDIYNTEKTKDFIYTHYEFLFIVTSDKPTNYNQNSLIYTCGPRSAEYLIPLINFTLKLYDYSPIKYYKIYQA